MTVGAETDRATALGVLARSGFRTLVTARFISLVGTGMAPIGLAFACLRDPSVGAGGLGISVGATVAGQLGFGLVGGAVADRFGPRYAMLVGDVTAGACEMLLAVAFAGHFASIGLVGVLAFIAGAAAAMSIPSLNAILRRLVCDNELTMANSLVRTSGALARITGAPLAGLLVAISAPFWVIASDGATFWVSAALLAITPVAHARPGGRMLTQLRTGWSVFIGLRWLVALAVASAIVNAARNGGLMVLGPITMNAHPHGSEEWGLLGGAQMAGSLVSLWTLARLNPHRILVASVAAVSATASLMFGLAIGAPFAVLLVLGFASGAGLSFFGIKTDTVIQRRVPAEFMGRVSAFDQTFSLSLSPIAAATIGELARRFSAQQMLGVCALIVLLTILATAMYRQVRIVTLRDAERPLIQP